MRLSRGKSGKDVQCRTPGLDQSKTGWAIRQRLASRRELADGLCGSAAGSSSEEETGYRKMIYRATIWEREVQ